MSSLHDIWRGDVIPQSGIDVAIGRNSLDFSSPVVPLLDVHLRRLELHDSGAPAQSGIIQYNSESEHLELIPAQSGTQPLVAAVYLHVRNTTTPGLGGNLDSPLTVPLNNNVLARSNVNDYTLESSVISIWGSGTHEISLRTGSDNTQANRNEHRTWIEIASDTGSFVEVPGSRAFSYHRLAANGEGSTYVTVILNEVAPGTRIRGRIAVEAVSPTAITGQIILANSCGFTIRRL